MSPETFYDLDTDIGEMSFDGFRCIDCGDIIDDVIYRNRYAPTPPQPRIGVRRTKLTEEDEDLLQGGRIVSFLDYMEQRGCFDFLHEVDKDLAYYIKLYVLKITTRLQDPVIESCFEKGYVNGVTLAQREVPKIMKKHPKVHKFIWTLIKGVLKECK